MAGPNGLLEDYISFNQREIITRLVPFFRLLPFSRTRTEQRKLGSA